MAQFVELLDNEQPLEYELAYLIEQAQNPDLGDDVKVSEDQVQDMMLNLPETLRKSLPLLVEKSSSSDSDLEGMYNLIFCLLTEIAPESQPEAVQILTDNISAATTMPGLRLRLLCHLFNSMSSLPVVQPAAFTATLEYALKTKQSKALVPQLSNAAQVVEQWRLPTKQASKILMLLARVHEEAGQTDAAHQFRVKYLRRVGNEIDQEAIQTAIDTVLKALQCPDQLDAADLLDIPAVQHLQDSNAELFVLVSIVAADDVQAFVEFCEGKDNFLHRMGVNYEKTLSKLRTNCLCTMGMQQQELDYDTAKERLMVDSDDALEDAVMDAVGSGFVEVKLDQSARIVTIEKATRQHFTADSWTDLRDRLSTLREQVDELIQGIAKSRMLSQQQH